MRKNKVKVSVIAFLVVLMCSSVCVMAAAGYRTVTIPGKGVPVRAYEGKRGKPDAVTVIATTSKITLSDHVWVNAQLADKDNDEKYSAIKRIESSNKPVGSEIAYSLKYYSKLKSGGFWYLYVASPDGFYYANDVTFRYQF